MSGERWETVRKVTVADKVCDRSAKEAMEENTMMTEMTEM